jgi:hypothetical protein
MRLGGLIWVLAEPWDRAGSCVPFFVRLGPAWEGQRGEKTGGFGLVQTGLGRCACAACICLRFRVPSYFL